MRSVRNTLAGLACAGLLLTGCGGESPTTKEPEGSDATSSSVSPSESPTTQTGTAACASADVEGAAADLGVKKLETESVGDAGGEESCTFMSPSVDIVIAADYLAEGTDVAKEVDAEVGGRDVESSEPEIGGQPGHLIVTADERAGVLIVTSFVELADGRLLRVRGQNSEGPSEDSTPKLERAVVNLSAGLAGAA